MWLQREANIIPVNGNYRKADCTSTLGRIFSLLAFLNFKRYPLRFWTLWSCWGWGLIITWEKRGKLRPNVLKNWCSMIRLSCTANIPVCVITLSSLGLHLLFLSQNSNSPQPKVRRAFMKMNLWKTVTIEFRESEIWKVADGTRL